MTETGEKLSRREFVKRAAVATAGALVDILGHSTVEVTRSYYGIFTADELQRLRAKHSPIARLE